MIQLGSMENKSLMTQINYLDHAVYFKGGWVKRLHVTASGSCFWSPGLSDWLDRGPDTPELPSLWCGPEVQHGDNGDGEASEDGLSALGDWTESRLIGGPIRLQEKKSRWLRTESQQLQLLRLLTRVYFEKKEF